MANRFFANIIDILPFTRMRARDVESNISAVESGFDVIQVEVDASVRAPNGETLNRLPSAAARQGLFMAFAPTTGQPVAIAGTPGPTGPTGPTGPQGIPGAIQPNVSNTFTVTPQTISASSANTVEFRVGNTSVPKEFSLFVAGALGPTPSGSFGLYDRTANAPRWYTSTTGTFVINVPTSGQSLALATLDNSGITLTNGTQAGAITASTGLSAINLWTTSNHGLTFGTNNTSRVTISATGGVTISQPASGLALDVTNSAAGTSSVVRQTNAGGDVQALRLANTSGSVNSAASLSLDPGSNGFGVRDVILRGVNNGSNATRLEILTANSDTPALRATFNVNGLAVNGAISVSGASGGQAGGLFVANSSIATCLMAWNAAANPVDNRWWDAGLVGGTEFVLRAVNDANNAAVSTMTMTRAGAVTFASTATATNFITSSDARLKRNIKPLAGSREKVRRLLGVNYERVDAPGVLRMGVIAQDTEMVAPEVVSTMADGYKAVAMSDLVALLIEAFKELDAKVPA